MREIVHIQAGQCGNQIGAKVSIDYLNNLDIGGESWINVREVGGDKVTGCQLILYFD